MYTLSRIPKCILQVISKITLNLLYRLTKGKLLTKCYSAKPILQTWLYLNCSTDLTLMEVPKRCTPLGVYKSLIKSYKRLILKENIYGHRHSSNILDIRLGTRTNDFTVTRPFLNGGCKSLGGNTGCVWFTGCEWDEADVVVSLFPYMRLQTALLVFVTGRPETS